MISLMICTLAPYLNSMGTPDVVIQLRAILSDAECLLSAHNPFMLTIRPTLSQEKETYSIDQVRTYLQSIITLMLCTLAPCLNAIGTPAIVIQLRDILFDANNLLATHHPYITPIRPSPVQEKETLLAFFDYILAPLIMVEETNPGFKKTITILETYRVSSEDGIIPSINLYSLVQIRAYLQSIITLMRCTLAPCLNSIGTPDLVIQLCDILADTENLLATHNPYILPIRPSPSQEKETLLAFIDHILARLRMVEQTNPAFKKIITILDTYRELADWNMPSY